METRTPHRHTSGSHSRLACTHGQSAVLHWPTLIICMTHDRAKYHRAKGRRTSSCILAIYLGNGLDRCKIFRNETQSRCSTHELKLTHHQYQRHLALLNVRVPSSNQRDCKERTCIKSNQKSITFRLSMKCIIIIKVEHAKSTRPVDALAVKHDFVAFVSFCRLRNLSTIPSPIVAA